MRQLKYSIPIERGGRPAQIEAMIAKEAIRLNGSCQVTYETLHTASEIFSTMITTLVVMNERCDYIHRAMQKIIALAVDTHSPDTDTIQVTDVPVMDRNFNVKEL